MAVALSCPHCNVELKLKRKHPINKIARCPQCKGVVPLTPPSDEAEGDRAAKSPASEETRPTKQPAVTQSEKQSARTAEKNNDNFLAPPQQPDELGRLGPYRVLSRIGVGGMGMVFRAEETSLQRQVALKVMLPQFASKPRRKARFLREAKAQAKIEHEHVVAIFRADEVDGVAFIAMPLLKGQALSTALSQNSQPPLKEVLRIGREMAEGLGAAHEAGLIHRDIKPSNVWLDGKRRRVKILDFGLARVADTTENEETEEGGKSAPALSGDGHLTMQGAVVGTPLYMSPEQARAEKVDHRTDLFSLGIVLYQMTTGSLPFAGQDTLGILEAVKNHNPIAPNLKNPEIPKVVSDFILHLLAKQVSDRPSSAEEVAEEIQQLESSLSAADIQLALPMLDEHDPWRDIEASEFSTLDSPGPQTLTLARDPKPRLGWGRRSAFITFGVASLVAASLVAVLFVWSNRPKPQSDPDPALAKTSPTPSKSTTTPQPDPVSPPAKEITPSTKPQSVSPPPKETTGAPKPPVPSKGFAWPAEALRDGRITLLDLSSLKSIRIEDFDDPTTGWPQGQIDSKAGTVQRGYRDGIYFIRKEFDGGVVYLENPQFVGYSTAICQVEGRVVDDPAAAWEVWFGNESQRKALSIKLTGTGKLGVGITKYDGGDQELLFAGTHAAIRKGSEFNKVVAIFTAERLELYVNGVAVCDPIPVPIRLQPVNIALGMSGGGKCSTEFRRLVVGSAEGLATPEDRLKAKEVPVKTPFAIPFVWPAISLREGKIALPKLDQLKLLKADDFSDPSGGWPQGKSENKGFVIQQGYQDGTYFIRKEYKAGWAYGGSRKFVAFSSFVCQVDGRVVDDVNSSWDLWFGNDQQRKAVTVRLNGAGKFKVALWDYDKGDMPPLISGSHAAIKKGTDFNTLTVVYVADRLELFVNGAAICDPVAVPLHLQPVRLSLGVSTGGKGAAEFRKLSTWSADGLAKPEDRLKAGVGEER